MAFIDIGLPFEGAVEAILIDSWIRNGRRLFFLSPHSDSLFSFYETENGIFYLLLTLASK